MNSMVICGDSANKNIGTYIQEPTNETRKSAELQRNCTKFKGCIFSTDLFGMVTDFKTDAMRGIKKASTRVNKIMYIGLSVSDRYHKSLHIITLDIISIE